MLNYHGSNFCVDWATFIMIFHSVAVRVSSLRLSYGVDGKSAIYDKLEMHLSASRGVDFAQEQHLVHGPGAFRCTPEQI